MTLSPTAGSFPDTKLVICIYDSIMKQEQIANFRANQIVAIIACQNISIFVNILTLLAKYKYMYAKKGRTGCYYLIVFRHLLLTIRSSASHDIKKRQTIYLYLIESMRYEKSQNHPVGIM